MSRWAPTAVVCLGMVVGLVPLGCKSDNANQAKELPKVIVQPVEEKALSENEFFTGRTAAVETVEVRARATGFLQEVKFKDGAEVIKDAELFIIDDAPYKADHERFVAEEKRISQLLTEVLNPKYDRERGLVGGGSVSREQFEKTAGDRLQAVSQLAAAKEASKRAKISLDYCIVKAPIAGKIGVARITEGNLVTGDNTLLTTIVSVETMYGYFDVDENTVLALQKRIREERSLQDGKDKVEVWLGLPNEKKGGDQMHPHLGYVDFVDNKVDPTTGTLKVRGVFPNPLLKGVRLLTPGLFCRFKVPIGARAKALWVSDKSVVTELGKKFVYVVNDKNIVEARPVQLFKAEGNMRPIEPLKVVRTKEGTWRLAHEGEKGEDSLKVNERVIVSGVLSVRPGVEVAPALASKSGS